MNMSQDGRSKRDIVFDIACVFFIVVFFIIITYVFYKITYAYIAKPVAAITCPNGQYLIDEEKGICKIQPTGCPYGDSIPVEHCDKFEQQSHQTEVPQYPVENINFTEFEGK